MWMCLPSSFWLRSLPYDWLKTAALVSALLQHACEPHLYSGINFRIHASISVFFLSIQKAIYCICTTIPGSFSRSSSIPCQRPAWSSKDLLRFLTSSHINWFLGLCSRLDQMKYRCIRTIIAVITTKKGQPTLLGKICEAYKKIFKNVHIASTKKNVSVTYRSTPTREAVGGRFFSAGHTINYSTYL